MTNPLGKALRRDWAKSQVPMPWSLPVEPLRGNLVVVLGSPGQGKSALALNMCLKTRMESLMLSLDTDLATQGIRTASIMAGVPQNRIKEAPRLWADYVDRKAKLMRTYDLSLSSKELMQLVEAETEYWGRPPAFTVVDNVQNLLTDHSYEAHRNIFIDLHRVARRGHTCVIALHHIKRGSQPGKPLALWDGQFAGEQEAEIVLGLWQKEPTTETLCVSILKNRSGKADPSGNLWTALRFNRDTMAIDDYTPLDHALWALKGGL